MVLSVVTAPAARFASESQSVDVLGAFGSPNSGDRGIIGSTGVMGAGANGERARLGETSVAGGGERKMSVGTKSLPRGRVAVRGATIKIDTNPTWRAATAANAAPLLVFHCLPPTRGQRSREPTPVWERTSGEENRSPNKGCRQFSRLSSGGSFRARTSRAGWSEPANDPVVQNQSHFAQESAMRASPHRGCRESIQARLGNQAADLPDLSAFSSCMRRSE
jgi:hypothetical protein